MLVPDILHNLNITGGEILAGCFQQHIQFGNDAHNIFDLVGIIPAEHTRFVQEAIQRLPAAVAALTVTVGTGQVIGVPGRGERSAHEHVRVDHQQQRLTVGDALVVGHVSRIGRTFTGNIVEGNERFIAPVLVVADDRQQAAVRRSRTRGTVPLIVVDHRLEEAGAFVFQRHGAKVVLAQLRLQLLEKVHQVRRLAGGAAAEHCDMMRLQRAEHLRQFAMAGRTRPPRDVVQRPVHTVRPVIRTVVEAIGIEGVVKAVRPVVPAFLQVGGGNRVAAVILDHRRESVLILPGHILRFDLVVHTGEFVAGGYFDAMPAQKIAAHIVRVLRFHFFPEQHFILLDFPSAIGAYIVVFAHTVFHSVCLIYQSTFTGYTVPPARVGSSTILPSLSVRPSNSQGFSSCDA